MLDVFSESWHEAVEAMVMASNRAMASKTIRNG